MVGGAAQGRTVRVRASDRVRTAAVLGLTRPVIAVPRDASEALTPHEIDQVVLHEYAHVQRYDDWTKLLQVLIGAFFGWHPAVRLMMREIDFEREAACDDYVVDVTGAPRAYARCLTKVIEMMPGPGLAAVPYASSSAHTCNDAHRTAAGSASSVWPARGDARDGRQRHARGARLLHGSRTSDRHRSSPPRRLPPRPARIAGVCGWIACSRANESSNGVEARAATSSDAARRCERECRQNAGRGAATCGSPRPRR